MQDEKARKPNRLINEKSPYLLQHAYNPVDWRPWGQEALDTAKKEDKPVLVSIGYSACHWCHVMEKESFENSAIAGIMNENFVCIKVDREERPDIDSLYMKAVQAMTGHGGWPLNAFTTPDGTPFYGGTYFPPVDTPASPSFKRVLLAVSLAYRNNKDDIRRTTSQITEALSYRAPEVTAGRGAASTERAVQHAAQLYDTVYGGFGAGTKFPQAMFLKFLLLHHKRTADAQAMTMLKNSLSFMASGGMYDQLGGGFHRYSVDERWEVPHFEKMLYDNSLLTELYSLAFELTGSALFREVASATADYIVRDMRDELGGFYSAEDADVDGVEGGFYVWRPDEIKDVLGEPGTDVFMKTYHVTEEGNFEGGNTLCLQPMINPQDALTDGIKKMKEALFNARAMRKRPDKDRKIITAWNGLAISALTVAGRALKRPDLVNAAQLCALFIMKSIRDGNGRLLRYHLGGSSGVPAVLEDYALLGAGLVSLYDSTGATKWLTEAKNLAAGMIELFYDPDSRVFFDTQKDAPGLFVRERDLFDNDIPSGNSAAAEFLLMVSRHTGNNAYREMSDKIIDSIEGLEDEPLSFGYALCVLESLLLDARPAKKTSN